MYPRQTLRSSRAAAPRHPSAACRAGLLALALLGLTVPHASARDPHRPRTREQGYNQTSDVIEAVDAKAHTVTIATVSKEVITREGTDNHHHDSHQEDGHKQNEPHTTGTMTLKVTDLTEIEVNGQKSNLGALHKGMKVDVTKGMDENTAGRLVTVQ